MSTSSDLRVFCSPERYIQGRDATLELGTQIKAVGLQGPVLIVSGKVVKDLLQEAWERSLGPEGIEYIIFDFGGECTVEEIDAIEEEAKRKKCQAILGAGGGKTIDAARAAAESLSLPMISCPTLASTDAPCSALSVVYKSDGSFHKYLFHRRHPILVLVDTSIVAKAPKRMLVGGLGDALATWFEARTVSEACKDNFLHGKSTLAGTTLAKLCCDILLQDGPAACQAVECQVCTPALERVVEGN